MFGDGSLTFREFASREPLPLATIHDAVLDFLRGRDDVALIGAHAVNAYVDESRMSSDVDVVSLDAKTHSEKIRNLLAEKFNITLGIHLVDAGKRIRIYQAREPKNRHLVDIWSVAIWPPTQRVNDVLVVSPPELIANKIMAISRRQNDALAGTDWRDVALLLLEFPQLKNIGSEVAERLKAAGADVDALKTWQEVVGQEITAELDEDEFST